MSVGTARIDCDKLRRDARRRGHSLTSLFLEAGISDQVRAKVIRGDAVSTSTARKLDKTLAELPELSMVEFVDDACEEVPAST